MSGAPTVPETSLSSVLVEKAYVPSKAAGVLLNGELFNFTLIESCQSEEMPREKWKSGSKSSNTSVPNFVVILKAQMESLYHARAKDLQRNQSWMMDVKLSITLQKEWVFQKEYATKKWKDEEK